MKKVLVIAPYSYLPYFSGGQKFIARLLEYLGKEIDLTVISVADNDFSIAKSYKTLPLLKKTFFRYVDLSLIRKISQLVKKEKFDTLIWEHPYYAWLAFRIKRKTGVRTIIHTHNIEYQRFKSTGRWWWPVLKVYEKWSFKKADFLFFITPEDKAFAINNWQIDKQKCIELPFGIEIRQFPNDKQDARKKIGEKHAIPGSEFLLLFNGVLNYKPNLDALKAILDEINPLLQKQPSFTYKIIICGKGLPDQLNQLAQYAEKNIIFAGFVEDIETYIKSADLFLNPVQSGGGLKTKMVEAIAYGTTVIATGTGASGIVKKVCGRKLAIVPDNDWQGFADKIISNAPELVKTPEEFYDYYYWGNIIQKILPFLTDHATGNPEKKGFDKISY